MVGLAKGLPPLEDKDDAPPKDSDGKQPASKAEDSKSKPQTQTGLSFSSGGGTSKANKKRKAISSVEEDDEAPRKASSSSKSSKKPKKDQKKLLSFDA